MRKLFILNAFLCCLLFPNLASAKWKEVHYISGKATVYADFDRVKEKNGNYFVWLLWNYLEKSRLFGGNSGYDLTTSATIFAEFDCELHRVKGLTGTTYSKPWGKGPVTEEMSMPRKWEYSEPQSDLEKIARKVCKKVDSWLW